MFSENLLFLIIGLVVFDYILDQGLSYLNYKSSKSQVPEKLEGLYDQQEYEKSQRYQSARTRFGFVTSLFSTLITLGVISFGIFGDLDVLVATWTDDVILQSLLFFGVLFILSDIINLPFSSA